MTASNLHVTTNKYYMSSMSFFICAAVRCKSLYATSLSDGTEPERQGNKLRPITIEKTESWRTGAKPVARGLGVVRL